MHGDQHDKPFYLITDYDGSLETVSAINKTITVSHGTTGRRTFRLASDGDVIIGDNDRASINDLTLGATVHVRYGSEYRGSDIAGEITEKVDSITGTVSSVDAINQSIVVADGTEAPKTFKLPSTTVVKQQGVDNATISSVTTGARVKLSYVSTKSGASFAVLINLLPADDPAPHKRKRKK